MDNVYGIEEVLTLIFLCVLLGGVIMVGMTVFLAVIAVFVILGLLLVPFMAAGFVKGFREAWNDRS